jgi:ubiquinone/menaquinone biosynthesis C-methylase UbiE
MNIAAPAVPKWSVCPWWLLYAFDNRVRHLVQKPERILQGLVRAGDTCLDIGAGFGYFTIPLARLVGPSGRVTAVDLQPEMLARVRRRAEQAGLADRIRLHQADAASLRLDAPADFALAFWMVHEIPDQPRFLDQMLAALKPGGHLALVEPKGHVGQAAFDRTIGIAEAAGFSRLRELPVFFSRGVLLAAPTRLPAGAGD